MNVIISIIRRSPSTLRGALGLRGARITFIRGKRKKSGRTERYSYHTFTIAEAVVVLNRELGEDQKQSKTKILRTLRKAGLVKDMNAVRDMCRQVAPVPDPGYSFLQCTCQVSRFVPHGWLTQQRDHLKPPASRWFLHQQMTNLVDMLRIYSEGVHHGYIHVSMALEILRQAAESGVSLDKMALRESLLSCRDTWGEWERIPNDVRICSQTGPSTE